MKKYWLYANMMYDIKHIRRVTWWRLLLGHGHLWLAEVEAESEELAAKKFKLMGFKFSQFSMYGE